MDERRRVEGFASFRFEVRGLVDGTEVHCGSAGTEHGARIIAADWLLRGATGAWVIDHRPGPPDGQPAMAA